jgi:hypothetical protein
MIVSGILMLQFVMPTPRQWLFLASYGLLGAAGNVLLMTAARMAPASLVAPPQYSQMLWAIAFGYLIFDDTIDLPMAGGILLIICSGLLTLARERKRGTPLPRAVVSTDNQAPLATSIEPDEATRSNRKPERPFRPALQLPKTKHPCPRHAGRGVSVSAIKYRQLSAQDRAAANVAEADLVGTTTREALNDDADVA